MKRGGAILLMGTFILLSACAGSGPAPGSPPSGQPATGPSLPGPTSEHINEVRLTIVYDNNEYNPHLHTNWGFSCLIEGLERTVLFDTGGDSATLLHNMKKLGIDPAEIDIVVLSHIHGDHVGGLDGFLKENSEVTVYMPDSFPARFKADIRAHGAQVEEISDAKELFNNVYTTGEMGNIIEEQSLVVLSNSGMVVITGCAHPGIVNIVSKAKTMLPEQPVYLVMGGFHLSGAALSHIERIKQELRFLGVEKIAPCHCSGDETRRLFKKEYGENYMESGAGRSITIP